MQAIIFEKNVAVQKESIPDFSLPEPFSCCPPQGRYTPRRLSDSYPVDCHRSRRDCQCPIGFALHCRWEQKPIRYGTTTSTNVSDGGRHEHKNRDFRLPTVFLRGRRQTDANGGTEGKSDESRRLPPVGWRVYADRSGYAIVGYWTVLLVFFFFFVAPPFPNCTVRS